MAAGSISVPTIVPLRPTTVGQSKSNIDTSTKIEIKSETPGTSIYYSLNGSKPEPFLTIGPAAKSTVLYKEPIYLPPGKRTIKAVAVSEDGRESFVVTKVFDVELNPNHKEEHNHKDGLHFIKNLPPNEEAKKEVRKFVQKLMTSKEAWQEVQKFKLIENGREKGTIRQSNSRFNSSREPTGFQLDMSGFDSSRSRILPNDASQALRLQRETDYMKCAFCLAPRPSDPHAKYCNECGGDIPPLPNSNYTEPNTGKLGTCIHCKSSVPFNLPNCLVCDAPLEEQNFPRVQLKFSEQSLCLKCGCVNPPKVHNCVTCGCALPDFQKLKSTRLPESKRDIGKTEDTRMLTCTKCSRINSSDARFCDWCGTKPSGVASLTPLICHKCHSSNDLRAQFCGTCGILLTPPLREELRNGGLLTNNGEGSHGQWLPVSVQLPGWANAIRMEAGTQTVGLYFPSQSALQNKNHTCECKTEKKIVLSAVSPGRGYWRRQVEHICGHIKAHATNNADFRALIGDPKMGKLLEAIVHEDSYELSLTVKFALRDATTKQNGNRDNVNSNRHDNASIDNKYKVTNNNIFIHEQSHSNFGSLDSLDSVDIEENEPIPSKKAVKKPKKIDKENKEELSDQTKLLFREIAKKGEGQPQRVQELIEHGANLKALNKEGLNMLHIAAVNTHADVIKIFVDEGLDVNGVENGAGNTALHLAVAQGLPAADTVDALLRCGASTTKKKKVPTATLR